VAAQETQEAPRRDMEKPQRAAMEARRRQRLELIEQGELVSNAPLRARFEWLSEHDPEFTCRVVCERLVDLGFPSFMRRKPGAAASPDTTHLLRVLGLRDLAPTLRGGRRYEPVERTSHIPYDLAVAVARALDMWPVDAGV
jgi:hypothetical protein